MTKGTVVHILWEWNSSGEMFLGVHVLMHIHYFFLRSSETGSLKSRINKKQSLYFQYLVIVKL